MLKKAPGIILLISLLLTAVQFTGCSIFDTTISESDSVYSWTLGSDNATFTITDVTVNGESRLSTPFTQARLAYNTNLDGYLTYSFHKDKDTTVIYTVTDYTGGNTAYNQWAAFFTTPEGQWALRPDKASNSTVPFLSYVSYSCPSTYEYGTYTDHGMWNGETFTVCMTWDAANQIASVSAQNSDNSKWYKAESVNPANMPKVYSYFGLSGENCSYKVSSITVNGVEKLSTDQTLSFAAYSADPAPATKITFVSDTDTTVKYTVTSYTPGAAEYEQWLAVSSFDNDGIWVLRPDHYSNATISTFTAPAYTGPTTYQNASLWAGNTPFTITMSWTASSKTLAVHVQDTAGTVIYDSSCTHN